MKHPLREILAHFAKHAEHTHDAAVQATYDLGHGAGAEEVKVKLLEGDKELHRDLDTRHRAKIEAERDTKDAADAAADPQPAAGDSDDDKEDAATGQQSQKSEDAAAGQATQGAKT